MTGSDGEDQGGEADLQIPRTFAALRHRNFRLFWTGQCVSLIGTWMQNIGQGWLVLQLTDSPLKLGLIGVLQYLPVTFLSLYGGVLADRLAKRSIILITQALLMVQAFTLALLVWTGLVRYEYVLLLAFFTGCITAVDLPTRQSFIMEMASREDLMNAISLNSTAFNAARFVGPALAGLAFAHFGAVLCFTLNGLSFLAVIMGLWLIDLRQAPPREESPGPRSGVWSEIGLGVRYVCNHQFIREQLAILVVMSVFTMNNIYLIPIYARYVIRGDARVFGWLASGFGLGALVGALLMANSSRRGPRREIIFLSGVGAGLSMLAVAVSRSFLPALLFLFLNGLALTGYGASNNCAVQIATEDQFRGRVMSVYAMIQPGLAPLGSYFVGITSEKLGAPASYALGGAAALLGWAVLLAVWYGRWRRGVGMGSGM